MNLSGRVEYLCWDNTEEVLYSSMGREAAYMEDTIAVAKRRALNIREAAASGGVYQAGDIVWLIPAVLYPKSMDVPKPADIITDRDGNEFTVLSAQGQRRDATGYQTYRCVTRNLAIAALMHDTVTIETPDSGTLDASHTELKTWRPLYAGVKCRVQPLDATVGAERAIRDMTTKYEVFLSRELAITTRERVVWPNALTGYLTITAYRNRQRIDELPVIECVDNP